jgi:hypothetical protein
MASVLRQNLSVTMIVGIKDRGDELKLVDRRINSISDTGPETCEMFQQEDLNGCWLRSRRPRVATGAAVAPYHHILRSSSGTDVQEPRERLVGVCQT